MATDYYPEPDDQTPAEGEDEGMEQEESGGKTALVPKSMLGSELKVGDTVTMKVTHIYEDEVELQPAGEGETEDEDEGETEMPGDEEFDEIEAKG